LFRAAYGRPGRTGIQSWRLERLNDAVFTDLYGLSPERVTELRTLLADWPRA
jgi:hypothetical protein